MSVDREFNGVMADVLVEQCIDRLLPILTHKRPVSYMSIPPNFDRDDDVYVLDRLQEVLKRLRLEKTSSEDNVS